MRRFAFALISAVIVATLSPVAAHACTASQIASGTCSVGGDTSGDGVDLWGDLTTGGSGGDGTGTPDYCVVTVDDRCVGDSPPKDGTTPTTVSDIESFRPVPPRQFGEPDGWAIRRVPTNFWSDAAPHVVSGELLGNPADVRFTPVSFRRAFGDGARDVNANSGSSWSKSGRPAWARTSTSHAYGDEGLFRIRLTVWYSAEYRFGLQEWRPLAGLVRRSANDLTVLVVDSETVLVHRICDVSSFGCD